MSFESGSLSFQRYAVVGQSPKSPDEELLKKLEEGALRPSEIGLPLDIEYGWVGPQHIFDARFDFEHCVFNDCIHVGLRIDTNKVPGEVKAALGLMEEAAAAKDNQSGFISKQQKRLAKDSTERKLDEELRTGKYRRSKHVPILWDVPNSVVYAPASTTIREKLTEIFERTFGLELHVLSSGSVAGRELERRAKRREYEDFVPTRFARSQEDADMPAEYPWTAKGDGAKDFLGDEFLLWLWHETRNGNLRLPSGDVSVMFDRTLQLDCVFGQTGKDTLNATGPTKLPEAIDALRFGKVPRKAGLMIDAPAGQFSLNLSGGALNVGSLKLPEIEKAETVRQLFEERITLLRDFVETLDAMYFAFLTARASGWNTTTANIQKWIASHVRPIAQVA